ncbi:MAG TPA: PAS domain-containing protein [Rhizomicrobium sp.]
MPVLPDSELICAFNARAKAHGWPFRCAPAGDFEHGELNSALALWRSKAAGRAMPSRTDMTARAMKPYLTQMSLLERVAEDGRPRYRIRLHGSALARYAGDTTGKFVDEVVPGARLEGYRNLYDTVLAYAAPLRVVSHYQGPQIDYLIGETLLAPLAVPDAKPPLILSVTYAKPRSGIAGDGAAFGLETHA